MKKKVAVIVDAMSSGTYFAPSISKRGVPCVHVCSIMIIAPKGLHKKDFIENIPYTNLKEIVKKLKKYNIIFIVPGCETGVNLSDKLREEFKLFPNNPQLSASRYNKYKMIKTVDEANILTAKYIASEDLCEILAWYKKLKKKTIVLKPLTGTGGNLIFFCNNEKDIRICFHKILKEENIFGQKNKKVLATEFLKGTEYVVNCVSHGGNHYLADIYKYKKIVTPQKTIIYDYMEIVPSSYKHKKELFEYTKKILNALGIIYGSSHNEIMWTRKGPVMIESGARIMGGSISPDIMRQSIGRSQIDLAIDSFLNPAKFKKIASKSYKIKKFVLFKFLISSVKGKLKNIKYLDEIKNMKSFYQMELMKIGSKIQITEDLFSSPGKIVLLHHDKKIVMKDYRRLKKLEKIMFEV